MPIKRSLVVSSPDRMLIAPSGNTWREVHSAKRKRRKLSARLNGGVRSYLKTRGKGANKRCSVLTLTIDPQERTPKQAYEQMCKAWNALSTWWRKRYPAMRFFRTVELHGNGFPHFHVMLIAAPFIQQKAIVEQWKNLLGQTRAVVDIRAVRNPEHAIRYVTKYLLKQSEALEQVKTQTETAFKSNVEQALEWQKAADAARSLGLEEEARRCEQEARTIGGAGDELRIAGLIADIKRAKAEGRIESAVYHEQRLEEVKAEIQQARVQAEQEQHQEANSRNIADASWWGRRVRPWSASRGLLEKEHGTANQWWNNVSIVPFVTPMQAAMIASNLDFHAEHFEAGIGYYDFRANAPN